jgi:hypothetical protein
LNVSYPELRKGEPEEKDDLEGIPEGEPIEQKVDKVFSSLNETKNNPVCQPLSIVSLSSSLDGLEGSISCRKIIFSECSWSVIGVLKPKNKIVHRPTEMTHVVKWAEPGGRI